MHSLHWNSSVSIKPVYNTFGFRFPEGLTRYVYAGEQDRHPCEKCNVWLPDHEFVESCEWQCQMCGLLTKPREWNTVSKPALLTVCNNCYELLCKMALFDAGLKPDLR